MAGRPISRTGTTRAASRERDDPVLAAWRQFTAGEEIEAGVVRSPILRSWRRCRDVHGVDPRDLSPVPREDNQTSEMRYGGLYATVGGVAAAIAADLGGCVTTVTDGQGRIVASWTASALRERAEECSLEAGFMWSESMGGTTGMGTALVEPEPVFVSGAEHWRQDMHEWSCFGTALSDPVSDAPAVAITAYSPSRELVSRLAQNLPTELHSVERVLARQAYRDGLTVAERFETYCQVQQTKMIAIDWAGNVVAATADIAELLGLGNRGTTVMLDPRGRLRCLRSIVRDLAQRSLAETVPDPTWQETVILDTPFSPDTEYYSVSPVIDLGMVTGWILVGLGEPADVAPDDSGQAEPITRSRVVAVADGSALLLDPAEVRYAQADGHSVWLVTDCGRLRAATRGIDNLECEVSRHGFIRVHRSFLVNPARIRRVHHKGNGLLSLSTDSCRNEDIPVSRRSTRVVRRLLGI